MAAEMVMLVALASGISDGVFNHPLPSVQTASRGPISSFKQPGGIDWFDRLQFPTPEEAWLGPLDHALCISSPEQGIKYSRTYITHKDIPK